MHTLRIFFLSLFLTSLVFAEGESKFIKLSNGETVEIIGLSKLYMTGESDWILVANYKVDSIDDKNELRDRAVLIWEQFKPIVENNGMSFAAIKAIEYDDNTKASAIVKSLAFTIALKKNDNGEWFFLDGKPAN